MLVFLPPRPVPRRLRRLRRLRVSHSETRSERGTIGIADGGFSQRTVTLTFFEINNELWRTVAAAVRRRCCSRFHSWSVSTQAELVLLYK